MQQTPKRWLINTTEIAHTITNCDQIEPWLGINSRPKMQRCYYSQTAGNFYPMHPEKTYYTGFSLIQIMLFQSEYPWPKWQPLELWNLVFSVTDKYNTEQGSWIFCLDSRGDMIGYHNTGPGLGICGLVTKWIAFGCK